MLKAYILEDEIKAIELLKTYLQRIDFINLLGTARNPMTAFSYLLENEVDVLFLDINLPVMSGVDLFKSLRNPPKVIFTTAYPEYAVEGFTLEAVDYLVKPIPFPRFLQACNRLLNQQKTALHHNDIGKDILSDIVYVKSGPITHKLSWKEVLYLEKAENYVMYHTADKRILSRQTMSDLEEIFPSYICRIHKSYAVSLLHISRLERTALHINDLELPIGRTYRKGLIECVELLR